MLGLVGWYTILGLPMFFPEQAKSNWDLRFLVEAEKLQLSLRHLFASYCDFLSISGIDRRYAVVR